MVVYGGDEVSALVLDIGSHTTRAGYAGEDVPKCVIPTAHGYIDGPAPQGSEGAAEGGKVRKYFVGEEGANSWRDGMEVGSMMRDGLVSDPSALPSIVNHVLHHRLRVDPSSHPVLTTEPAWNTPKNRETMAELMFEQEGVPAWYTACSGVLSAFATGKGTALVVDIGSEITSVTPVSEGYVLRVGTRRQPLAMALLQSQMKAHLEAPQPGRAFPLDLTPHQLIKTRTPVPAGQPPKATLREDRLPGTTASWKEYQQGKVVEGWRESCGAVFETPFDERFVGQRPTRPFEFPDGYNAQYGQERFHMCESLFNPNFINRTQAVPESLRSTPTTPHSNDLSAIVAISKLAAEAVMACDLDVRASLLSNIVLVGGGSLLPGVADRFNWEMGQLAPAQKIRIHAPGHGAERRFSSWLGGSILASLGTFHQLWISKEEWKETGPNIIAQRCK